MDLKTYEKLKNERRKLTDSLDKGKGDRAKSLKRLDEIASQIKSDPPSVETVYASIDPGSQP